MNKPNESPLKNFTASVISKEIPEWCRWIAQESDGTIYAYTDKPKTDRDFCDWRCKTTKTIFMRVHSTCRENPNWRQAICSVEDLKQWEKQQKENQMSNNWIENTSGVCPVEKGTLIDVKFRDGQIMLSIPALETIYGSEREASRCFWIDDSVENDIIAWRLSVLQEQEVISSEPTYEGFCEYLQTEEAQYHPAEALKKMYECSLKAQQDELQHAKKLLESAGYSVVKKAQ